jgi:hypothetical protein
MVWCAILFSPSLIIYPLDGPLVVWYLLCAGCSHILFLIVTVSSYAVFITGNANQTSLDPYKSICTIKTATAAFKRVSTLN